MVRTVMERMAAIDWSGVEAGLLAEGSATVKSLFTAGECKNLRGLYSEEARFRSAVAMARHGFGSGEYKYFCYPLPDLIAQARETLYPQLAQIANSWMTTLGQPIRFPSEHAAFLSACHAAGQKRPTPLLLRYQSGDYNCLHQDLYGEILFPLQATVLLSKPKEEFEGGEFVLTEQRPRRQSRVSVVPLEQGDMIVFPVSQRPARGSHGAYRLGMRHGVSTVRSGERFALGLILHDAA